MDNKLLGNEKLINDIMNDFLSMSAANLPDIEQQDICIALDVLMEINRGQLYRDMLVAMAIVAKHYRTKCFDDSNYRSTYYGDKIIEEISPILESVPLDDQLEKFIKFLNLSIGVISLLTNDIINKILYVSNEGSVMFGFQFNQNQRLANGYYD
ncbi:MAG: hypothetical protein ACLSXJ_16680 [Clostridium saudiense]|uniref:hypothetical protein n=1 Tax=Clostridium saudiense TaxID=1414720 RepID=UPI003991F6E8